jgi:hypothetical protein
VRMPSSRSFAHSRIMDVKLATPTASSGADADDADDAPACESTSMRDVFCC